MVLIGASVPAFVSMIHMPTVIHKEKTTYRPKRHRQHRLHGFDRRVCPSLCQWYTCRQWYTKRKQPTAPNATDNIVCMVLIGASVPAFVSIPRLPTSSLPATVQNLTCFTPTVTNWLSESGRNSALKILWLCPAAHATWVPVERISTCITQTDCPSPAWTLLGKSSGCDLLHTPPGFLVINIRYECKFMYKLLTSRHSIK